MQTLYKSPGIGQNGCQRELVAFSLIELLLVMAIIGILSALLLTAVSRAKQRALQIACVGNLHQIGIELENFVANSHTYPSFFQPVNSQYPWYWYDQIQDRGVAGAKYGGLYIDVKGVWTCPAKNGSALFSYGYNIAGVDRGSLGDNLLGLDRMLPTNADFAHVVPVRESEVAVPAEMMAIGDVVANNFSASITFDRWYGTTARHLGRDNVLFCDGHVESPTIRSLFIDTDDSALVRWNRDHLPHREKL